MSQNDPKTTSLMTSLTKNPQPLTKKVQTTRLFFSVDYKTDRSIWALEHLFNAIGGGAMALV